MCTPIGALMAHSSLEWVSLPVSLVAGEQLVARLKALDPWGNPLTDIGATFAFMERMRVGSELEGEPDRIPSSVEVRS